MADGAGEHVDVAAGKNDLTASASPETGCNACPNNHLAGPVVVNSFLDGCMRWRVRKWKSGKIRPRK